MFVAVSLEASREPRGGCFGASWGPFWDVFGEEDDDKEEEEEDDDDDENDDVEAVGKLGSFEGLLGLILGLLGASWGFLAASWGLLGPSWGLLGLSRGGKFELSRSPAPPLSHSPTLYGGTSQERNQLPLRWHQHKPQAESSEADSCFYFSPQKK